jgi:phosphoglycolate phosphatase
MPAFETLLFDLDGTLIDSVVDLSNAVNYLRADLGLAPLDQAKVKSFVGDGALLLVKRSLPESLFEEIHIRTFLDYYRQHLVEHTRPYPGILDCLESCRDRAMAVVTNKPVELTQEILVRLDLLRFFPVVIGGDSCFTKKPDSLPVRQALLDLDRSPDTALMIGDHANDLLAGRAAGTRTCFCQWGLGSHRDAPRDFEVATPAQLSQLLCGRL